MNRSPAPEDPAREPVLDPELAARLDEAIAPLAPDAAQAALHARVKHRLLRRVAEDSTARHLTLAAAQGSWQPFGTGLQIKVLHEAGGIMSYLVRLEAGAGLPAHRHPVDEECVVLEGEVRIGTLRIGAGGFHLGRKDVLHDRLVSDGGALIFLRGAAPEFEQAL